MCKLLYALDLVVILSFYAWESRIGRRFEKKSFHNVKKNFLEDTRYISMRKENFSYYDWDDGRKAFVRGVFIWSSILLDAVYLESRRLACQNNWEVHLRVRQVQKFAYAYNSHARGFFSPVGLHSVYEVFTKGRGNKRKPCSV